MVGIEQEVVQDKPIFTSDKKICQTCGTSNKFKNKFCSSCGSRLAE
jgi:ribosomal protein S27AE